MSITPTLTPSAERDQRTFRTVVDCMAKPGKVGRISTESSSGSDSGAAVTLCRCLLDHEVSVAVVGFDPSLSEYILRVTGSRVADLFEADFIVASEFEALAAVEHAKIGSDEFPDASATIILACDRIGAGPVQLELSGPGVPSVRSLSLDGLDPELLESILDRNADYPLGIDVILVSAAGDIACLPRTTRFTIRQISEAG